MKLIKLFSIGIFLFLSFNVLGQGMSFNKDSFLTAPKLENTRGVTYSSYSLERYAPIPYAQNGGTCVAHAFTNARTILIAKELNVTKKEDIIRLLFSPYHFYYEVSGGYTGNCEGGLDLTKAAKNALNKGFCLLSSVEWQAYYPFTNTARCSKPYYSSSLSQNRLAARKFAPDNLYGVQSIDDIRNALSNNMPIIIGMAVPNSFTNCQSKTWYPASTDSYKSAGGHAMLIVGYDDSYQGGAVRIMNSWGTDWADGGFVWIKYTDFAKWAYGGYAMEKYMGYRSAETEIGLDEETLLAYLQVESQTGDSSTLELESLNEYIIAKITDTLNHSEIMDIHKIDFVNEVESIDGFPGRKHAFGPFRRAYGLED